MIRRVIELKRYSANFFHRESDMYYNYHAKAKALIAEGHLIDYKIVPSWNAIAPALVLFFDNHKPMPIREYRWDEYWKIL